MSNIILTNIFNDLCQGMTNYIIRYVKMTRVFMTTVRMTITLNILNYFFSLILGDLF